MISAKRPDEAEKLLSATAETILHGENKGKDSGVSATSDTRRRSPGKADSQAAVVLAKLILLRLLRRLGFDVRPEGKLTAGEADRRAYVVKALHGVRWPLHDHCRKVFHWSPAQVLVRFVLIQLFLVPLLFVLLVKVR